MGLLVKNKNGIYDDAAIPQAYDPALGAYRDAESALVRDGEIWREVWPERPEIQR